VNRGQQVKEMTERNLPVEVDMTFSGIWFEGIGHSTAGKLVRALMVAQQLSGFSQVPALKAIDSVAGIGDFHATVTEFGKNHGDLHAGYCDRRPVSTP